MWSTTIWHRLKPAVHRAQPMWVMHKPQVIWTPKIMFEGCTARYESVWYSADEIDMVHESTEKTPQAK